MVMTAGTQTRSRAMSAAASVGLTATGADSAVASLASCSILLVEDDNIVRAVVMAMLQRIGCRAQAAVNGADGLTYFEGDVLGKGSRIDLVLMDCEMPVLDGLSASAELRRRGVRVPIVAMTANTMAGDRERCFAAGMDDFLGKPVRLNDLRACLLRWSAWIAANANATATANASGNIVGGASSLGNVRTRARVHGQTAMDS